jgi:glycerate kinase
VVVATDKFKGSLPAAAVADALATGLRSIRPDLDIDCVPIADGGDGTVAAAVAAGFTRVELDATGPTGAPVRSSYARRGDEAVIELADVCGLARLPDGRLQPWSASTYGLGQVIAHALDGGARRLVVGIGGSASTDGGAGLLQALGARFEPRDSAVARGAAGLTGIKALELTPVRKRLAGVELIVASDVDNPLLGRHGAAAVYGSQKGAAPDDIPTLEAALSHWAAVVTAAEGADFTAALGAGAAGGAGFGLLAVGARITSGAELVLGIVGFDQRLDGAELVITGEGSLDEQTLAGKAPARVAAHAVAAGVRVIAVAGRCHLDDAQLRRTGIDTVHVLLDLEPDPARSMSDAVALLHRVGATIAAGLPVRGPA